MHAGRHSNVGLGRLDNIFTPKCMVSIYEKIDLTIQREKSRDMYITRTALIHLVRNKHATYLVNFKGSRATGPSLRGSWLQGYNMSKSSKISMALGRQVSKVKGIQG